ncbi:diphosphomevalonate decarboxylase [Chloroflexota bacterium]
MTNLNQATAVAFPNIAFIKYWGNIDHHLNIPTTGSISMNLGGLETCTTVHFDSALTADQLTLNNRKTGGEALARVSALLDRVRELSNNDGYAQITSENNFPTGSGIASSASAFAALALAASTAAGLELDEASLSRLARTGSGSASRSIPGGFVEWLPGTDHQSSFAKSIAPPEHWALADCVAIVSQAHKPTGSLAGHQLASTSPLQSARIEDAPRRLDLCRQALLHKDFLAFAEIIELDSNIMHAVMLSSYPQLLYWEPATLAVMQAVQSWRAAGLEAAFTIDAGPNVHVICLQENADEVSQRLANIPGVQKVRTAHPGGPAVIIA